MGEKHWITNVALEVGYEFYKGEITETKTSLFHFFIEDGLIKRIVPSSEAVQDDEVLIDAKGMLAVPAFQEKHIHLDKTYYSGPWKAPIKGNRFKRIAEEKELLPKLRPYMQERAEQLLQLIGRYGATAVRTHCNIESTSGLHNLEATQRALETYQNQFFSEIVAFPQHGLLRDNSAELVKEAMRNGAHLVGGVDPATFDENLERSLYTTVNIAAEFNAGIDLHLHNRGQLGTYTMKQLAKLTKEAGLQGKVTISHAYALGDVSIEEAEEVADLLADAQIDLTSGAPFDIPGIPFAAMREKGVSIALGNDSITDNWDPFGTGDMLRKARDLARKCDWRDERSLAKSLAYITGGKLPLDDRGTQLWPKPHDEASFVLLAVSCSAEAVARGVHERITLRKGNITFQDEEVRLIRQ
ncbi:amidohydrolase family protein [Priestia megaterium]|nr:amidohydrolase family protein [Priestia megaterium]